MGRTCNNVLLENGIWNCERNDSAFRPLAKNGIGKMHVCVDAVGEASLSSNFGPHCCVWNTHCSFLSKQITFTLSTSVTGCLQVLQET